MKRLSRVAVAAFLTVVAASTANLLGAGTDALVARAHFIGTDQLFAGTDGARLKELSGLPGTVALQSNALARFSRLPALLFGNAVEKGAPDQSALFRPLLNDLLQHESYLDVRATPEFVLAVRLPEARAKAWDTNLKQAFTAWKLGAPEEVKAGGFTGWEFRRKAAPARVRAGRMGDWFIVTSGPEALTLEPALAAAIKAGGRPAKATGAWLDGDLNLARIRGALPLLSHFDNLPVAHISLSNRADFVRTLVKLEFPKPHQWKAEPWNFPTNAIHDPLVSFLVARGIAPFLEAIPEVRRLGWTPTPNQVCGWGLGGLPFQFFYTTPSRDIPNQLKRAEPAIKRMFFQDHTNVLGQLAWDTNRTGLFWQGLPMAAPKLAPLGRNGEYLQFQMFPLAGSRTPPPKELIEQIGRDNVVLYDWELTRERVPHWRQFYQLTEIATRHGLSSSNAPANRFITDITPKLGECITEITATSPVEMTLIRKSTTGLSAVELLTISRWLESTSFPEFGVSLPKTPLKRPMPRNAPPKTP